MVVRVLELFVLWWGPRLRSTQDSNGAPIAAGISPEATSTQLDVICIYEQPTNHKMLEPTIIRQGVRGF